MREYRRFLDGFIVYTNDPNEINLFSNFFEWAATYATLKGKIIAKEFYFKLPEHVPVTYKAARKYIKKEFLNGNKVQKVASVGQSSDKSSPY
jgi:hypothetical protein